MSIIRRCTHANGLAAGLVDGPDPVEGHLSLAVESLSYGGLVLIIGVDVNLLAAEVHCSQYRA